jgi:hypothetical protein
MPQIDLVVVMKKPPGRCGICNTTPMVNGRPAEALDTNVDVDWGNNFYICKECGNVIADLLGRVDEGDFEELKDKHGQLLESHKTLRRRFKEQEEKMETIIKGRQAETNVKKKRKRKLLA